MDTYCLLNNEYKKTSEPLLKVNDLGLLRGYGVFDFFPIQGNHPVFFNDYWNRFRNSALQMRLPFEWEYDPFMTRLYELMDKNNRADGYCRLLLTGGYTNTGFLPDGPANFLVITQGPVPYIEENYTRGIKLITMQYTREHPHIKSINYMTVLLERDRIRNEDATDVLYLSEANITESSRSNFFIIDEKGILKTPQHDILGGITRSKVLELAQDFMEVEVTDLTLEDVKKARSAFITSTTKGIMPVTKIDDFSINESQISPVIHQLQKALKDLVNQHLDELNS
ncbi:aminotransferase class IV [Membranicola marinus]|uniref:branched-chain-amino-acid transaminase n=1 Tax=Membranihabitans marinus TaxID=1227546 RepID=A0A953HXS2_9BACT|nr:aminotransferase class IV [Membranihabitans marinus]MBY5959748.1 aminotransferase class IV [Membranihabitans marinus]